MRHFFTACASLLLLLITYSPTVLGATDARWYGALKASISEDTIDSIKVQGIGTGMLISGQVDGALEDDEVEDYTAGIGFAVGRRMGFWNIEVEYVYGYRTDWDVVTSTPSIQTITNVFNNVETNTVMLNFARRGPISQDWSWEAGAGLGLTFESLDSDYIERETVNTQEQKFSASSDETEFTYAVFAGLTRDLGGPWTFSTRLRYIDMGKLNAGPFPNRPGRARANHSAIELQFSLERNF